MTIGKEQEPPVKYAEGRITETPEEIPETIEAVEGVKRTLSQFGKQVPDDSGQPLTQSSTTPVTISIPADDSSLNAQSKGSTDDSLTWFAAFWMRIIKKAMHFGWKIIKKEERK